MAMDPGERRELGASLQRVLNAAQTRHGLPDVDRLTIALALAAGEARRLGFTREQFATAAVRYADAAWGHEPAALALVRPPTD